jgi:uncharacterized membrane protein (UPF0136 family)
VAFLAGFLRTGFVAALFGYVVFGSVALIASILGAHGSFTGSSIAPAWYSGLLFIAAYTVILCSLDAVPVGIFFMLGRSIMRRVTPNVSQ